MTDDASLIYVPSPWPGRIAALPVWAVEAAGRAIDFHYAYVLNGRGSDTTLKEFHDVAAEIAAAYAQGYADGKALR